MAAGGPSTADYRAMAREFGVFNTREVNDIIQQFQRFDHDGNGSIDKDELAQCMHQLGNQYTDADVDEIIKETDLDGNQTIEFGEYLTVLKKIKDGTSSSKMGAVVSKVGDSFKVSGATAASSHSFSEEEKRSFTDFINMALAHQPIVEHLLPMDPESMDLFDACHDGTLLCALIADADESAIDLRAVNTSKLNNFKIVENQNLCINSAKAIGCNVVNIGHADLTEGVHHLVLGLVWQIIRIGLLNQINLANHPGLYLLLEEGEELADFLKLPADQILLRWLNYHLAAAGSERRVHNFGGDIKDSEAYTVVLNQLNKNCSLDPLNVADPVDRAEQMLQQADKLECRKFVTPNDVASGNRKLNLAFVANLFNTCPALILDEQQQEELAALDMSMFDSEGDREARVFALWINSLGIEPFVRNLYDDLRDGLVLLRVIDKIAGIVNWSKVCQKVPMNRFKALGNANYAVELCRDNLGFSLVGIAGSDVYDGNRTLTLAIVWQLLRLNLINLISALSGSGAKITDADVIAWANETVAAAGKDSSMSDFRDSSLATGYFYLDLVDAIRPGTVEAEYVVDGDSEDDNIDRTKYAIALARRLGAAIFSLPSDLVEGNAKLAFSFLASLMAVHKGVSATR